MLNIILCLGKFKMLTNFNLNPTLVLSFKKYLINETLI